MLPVLLSLGPVATRNYAEMLIIINHQTLITPKAVLFVDSVKSGRKKPAPPASALTTVKSLIISLLDHKDHIPGL